MAFHKMVFVADCYFSLNFLYLQILKKKYRLKPKNRLRRFFGCATLGLAFLTHFLFFVFPDEESHLPCRISQTFCLLFCWLAQQHICKTQREAPPLLLPGN